MNRRIFLNYVRNAPFGGRLVHAQIDGINRILDEWKARGLLDDRWLAYMLATVFWETAKTMQPVREMGGEAYLRSKRYYPWVGEGLVQVTWEANHRKFGATKPGELLTWPIALKAMFDGMTRGMFTGKSLRDYFNETRNDPRGARKIINGTDKADLIAGFYASFLAAIKAAKMEADDVEPAKATERNAQPDDVKPTDSTAVLTAGGLLTTGVAAIPAIGGISSAWGFAALALIVVAGGIAAWLVMSGRVTINRGA
jgi:hypothetical protein